MSATNATVNDLSTSEAVSDLLSRALRKAFGRWADLDVNPWVDGQYGIRVSELVHAATNQAFDDVYRDIRFLVDVPKGLITVHGRKDKTVKVNLRNTALDDLAKILRDLSKDVPTPAASWMGEDDTPCLQETHSWYYTER